MKKLTDERKKDLLQDYTVWMEDDKGNSKLNLPNLGELIFNELDYYFLTTIDNEQIYCYNGGYYEPTGEQIIKDCVEQFLEDQTKEHYKKEVIGYIRDKNYQKRELFESNIDLINLKNGVYNLKTRKFTDHKPENYFLNEIPVDYNPKVKMKIGLKFFKDVVAENDVPLLQEIFGYCLYRSYFIQKAFMFIGDGRNGKSTVLSLLKTMLGTRNVSGVALQDLDISRFATASLYHKMANIYPDITDKALNKTGKFKMLTGGDMISAEIKFRDHFNFVNYAKLIFSCNKLPEAKDDSSAYFRRWILINFPYTFEGANCDKKILEKLTTEKELSGLLNWSLKGLRRLLKNGDFTNTISTDEMRDTYQRLASPIAAFVMDWVEIKHDGYIKKDDFFDAFCEYCRINRLPVIAKNVFSMKIHEYVKVSDYRPKIGSNRVHCWMGIGLSDVSKMSKYNLILNACEEESYDNKIGKHPDNLDTHDTQEELHV